MFVGSSQQVSGFELEIFVQLYFPVFYIVYFGTYLIHTVRRVDSHYIVNARTAEGTERKVDGLVASIA